MHKIDTWWWLSTPYSVSFPLLLLVLGLREGAGAALGLFVYLGILCTCSAVAWMVTAIYRIAVRRNAESMMGTRIKIGFVVLSVLLWTVLLSIPTGPLQK
jgi:hypothetical protein